MLKRLFLSLVEEERIPHVKHIIYPCLMIAVGYRTLFIDHWYAFGLTFFSLGILFALVIMFAIAWRGPIEYWQKIKEVTEQLNKIKSPEVWHALGFKQLPQQATIVQNLNDEKGNLVTTKYLKPSSLTPTTLNQIANKVILSKNYDFTQEIYGNLIPNFRKVQAEMKKLGYISPKNSKNVRKGYRINRKGFDLCYQYADEIIKLTAKKEGK